MAKSMCEKEFQKKSDELAKYIDRKARQFRRFHFGYGLKEIKEFICLLFKNAPSTKPRVSEENDGWIAKDKNGDFWYGTLGKTKEDVESHFDNRAWKEEYKFKIVKVKLVEVK